MAKRGRPTKATRVAPPGTKYCASGDHFADLIDFVGKDSYCKTCRKKYNKRYQESLPKPPKADILGVHLRVYCTACETLLDIMTDSPQESGKWVCPECGAEMEGSIRINLRGIDLT